MKNIFGFAPHFLRDRKGSVSLTSFKKGAGFTLVELLVVMGIFIILALVAFSSVRFFQRESDLNNSAERIINILRLSQNKTLASEGANQYGVYFSTSTSVDQYILFKGSDYQSRATSFDETYQLAKVVEISVIDLTDGGWEIVFDKLTGETNQFGSLSLQLKTDPGKKKIIYIENSGRVGLTSPSIPSQESRIKDSRHVHFDYSRQISTSSESLTLTFTYDTSTTSKEIIIANYLKNDQIDWQGEVDLAGEIQEIRIHTHRLNDPLEGTQFSIHRDQRYNNRALIITIDGDATGELIQYDAGGQTATGTSIYVTEPDWQ